MSIRYLPRPFASSMRSKPWSRPGCSMIFPKLSAWRLTLAARDSVKAAVPADFVDIYLSRLRSQDAEILKAA